MKTQDKFILVIGAVIGVFAAMGGLVAMVYWLLGRMDSNGLHWYAVVVTLALPVTVIVTYRMATHWAREHLAGFDRGLTGAQKTVETMGRSLSATASLARTSARPVARTLLAGANDDLLPKVGAMRLIESRRGIDDVIDL